MADFGFFIEGDNRVSLRFDSLPQDLRVNLKRVIGVDIAELAAAVKSAVPKKTGSLESKVTSGVKDTSRGVVGVVTFSGDFAKAGALEYGSTGKAFGVKPHPMQLDHVFATMISPEQVLVNAYQRASTITAHRFLRGPLESRKAQIESDLEGAVEQTVRAGENE